MGVVYQGNKVSIDIQVIGFRSTEVSLETCFLTKKLLDLLMAQCLVEVDTGSIADWHPLKNERQVQLESQEPRLEKVACNAR